jgi:hypothetical protein
LLQSPWPNRQGTVLASGREGGICTADVVPSHVRPSWKETHPEVMGSTGELCDPEIVATATLVCAYS